MADRSYYFISVDESSRFIIFRSVFEPRPKCMGKNYQVNPKSSPYKNLKVNSNLTVVYAKNKRSKI